MANIETTSGTLYNGVEYVKKVETFTRTDGVQYRHITTDYSKNGKSARVIEFAGRCSIGRQNAEMWQTAPVTGKARTYKHKENAHAKAIELVLA